ncbi:ankyrin repeat domain-containing protein [Marinospirillum minutulum]|uniref:ankyrin repeat domain-containing protein n=1 Tax=Marinospirillum minutulum TaxID=64974 RepID=UPI000406C3DE|nr:ankyrin repeat domain-containing protein [Marinospirillum minutulum]
MISVWDDVWDRLPEAIQEATTIDSYGDYTPLTAAAALGDTETLTWLLKLVSPQQINHEFEVQDNMGNLLKTGNALTEALLNNHLNCAQKLFDAGCSVDILTSNCIDYDNADLANVGDYSYYSAIELAYARKVDNFDSWLYRANDLTIEAPDGNTLISRAIRSQKHDLIQLLANHCNPKYRFMTTHSEADYLIPAGHYAALRVIFSNKKARESALETLRVVGRSIGFCISWPGSEESCEEESLVSLLVAIADPEVLRLAQLDKLDFRSTFALREEALKVSYESKRLIDKAYTFIDLFNTVAPEIDPYVLTDNSLLSRLYNLQNTDDPIANSDWAYTALDALCSSTKWDKENEKEVFSQLSLLEECIYTISELINEWIDKDDQVLYDTGLNWLNSKLVEFKSLIHRRNTKFSFADYPHMRGYMDARQVSPLCFGFEWLIQLRKLDQSNTVFGRAI